MSEIIIIRSRGFTANHPKGAILRVHVVRVGGRAVSAARAMRFAGIADDEIARRLPRRPRGQWVGGRRVEA